MASEKTILVTGGAGFIGSHTVRALLDQGRRVLILDQLSNGYTEAAAQQAPLIQESLLNLPELYRVFDEHDIEAVIHFAAYIEVGESVRNPLAYYSNNLIGTLNLLEAMTAYDVRNLVFSSTAAVYGNVDAQLMTEDLPRAPINPYGHSKAQIEQVLEDMAASNDLNVIALRYFNASGASPDLGLGEMHEPETHLIPLVLEAGNGKRQSIAIFGDDYPTPDGTCQRDYIHVRDLASAHVKAADRLIQGAERPAFEALNLGTGQGYSVRQIIDAVANVTELNIDAVIQDRRPGDPARLVANADKAKQALDWQPQHSDIKTIVTDAHRFFQSQAWDQP